METRLPKDVLRAAMRQIGAKGGKAAAENMTEEERRARAIKASKAAAAARTKKQTASRGRSKPKARV